MSDPQAIDVVIRVNFFDGNLFALEVDNPSSAPPFFATLLFQDQAFVGQTISLVEAANSIGTEVAPVV